MTLAVGVVAGGFVAGGFVLVVIGYAIGTFPSAVIIARRQGIDIARSGSGNPGASNVARRLGWKAGAIVFGLDAAKGALAGVIGLVALGRPGAYLVGAAAIIGHMFPLGRPGGKGVASGAGVLAVVHPLLVPIALGLWLVVGRLTHTAAIASLAAAASVPVGLIVTGTRPLEIVAAAAIVALIVGRHLGNISRIARGTEHRLPVGATERR